jgi:hypothetical protein
MESNNDELDHIVKPFIPWVPIVEAAITRAAIKGDF